MGVQFFFRNVSLRLEFNNFMAHYSPKYLGRGVGPVLKRLWMKPPCSKTQVVYKNLLLKKMQHACEAVKFIILIFRSTHLDPFPDFDKDRIASLLSVILRKEPNVFRSIWQVNFGYTRTKNKNRFFNKWWIGQSAEKYQRTWIHHKFYSGKFAYFNF